MGTDDSHKLVLLQEVSTVISPKKYGTVSLVIANIWLLTVHTTVFLLNRVGPNKVANRPIEWHFIHPIQFLNLVDMLSLCRYASMHTEVVLIDNCSQRQGVEGIHYVKVYVLVVLFLGLRVKVHDLSHLSCFVVAPEHEGLPGVLDLQCHQEQRYFYALRPTIDIISQEKKVFLGLCVKSREETQDFEEIEELSMNIANNYDGFLQFDDVGFVS